MESWSELHGLPETSCIVHCINVLAMGKDCSFLTYSCNLKQKNLDNSSDTLVLLRKQTFFHCSTKPGRPKLQIRQKLRMALDIARGMPLEHILSAPLEIDIFCLTRVLQKGMYLQKSFFSFVLYHGNYYCFWRTKNLTFFEISAVQIAWFLAFPTLAASRPPFVCRNALLTFCQASYNPSRLEEHEFVSR